MKAELVSEKVILTPDQERGLQELLAWWKLPKNHPDYFNCVFAAPAGCGKTFLAKHFTKMLPNAFPLFTATTNEAARQLELTGLQDVRTTHSALGLIPSMQQENTSFYQKALPEYLAEHNLLIIDEASMAGIGADTEEEIKLIGDYALDLGMRILWLGDSYQLPPIETQDGIAPIFTQGFLTVALTEVVRNKGVILEFCTALRKSIDSSVRKFPSVPRGISSITYPKLYAMLKDETFLQGVKKGNTVIITWRNANVDELNKQIRIGLFGKELAAKPYLPTDQILFTKPLLVGVFPTETRYLVGNKQIKQGASVNSRAEIIKVIEAELYGIECYKCSIRLEGGIMETAWIPTASGNNKLNKLRSATVVRIAQVSSSKKASMWEEWHAFRNCFASVKHSYAITTHRSQGSTIPNVIVNVIDILAGVNRSPLLAYKMLYTACSRASCELTLIRS
jgi:hypothetical protein